jgi:hypothetical protein
MSISRPSLLLARRLSVTKAGWRNAYEVQLEGEL